jgi:hypothetical protein
MKFIALTPGNDPRSYICEAPTWTDARVFSGRMLGVDPAKLECIQTESTRPDAELEWRGTDYGNKPNRTLWCRLRQRDGQFGEWMPATDAPLPEATKAAKKAKR